MCCLYHRSPQSDKEYNQWIISWNKTNMTKVFHFLWLKRGLNLGDIIIDVVDVIRGWTKLKPCTHQMLCEKRMWEISIVKKPQTLLVSSFYFQWHQSIALSQLSEFSNYYESINKHTVYKKTKWYALKIYKCLFAMVDYTCMIKNLSYLPVTANLSLTSHKQ